MPDVRGGLLARQQAGGLLATRQRDIPTLLGDLMERAPPPTGGGPEMRSYPVENWVQPSWALNTGDTLNIAMSLLGPKAKLPTRKGAAAGARATASDVIDARLRARIPKAAQPREILRQTKEKGGYTVNLETGEKPTTGIMVGSYRNTDPRNRVIEGDPTMVDITSWIKQNEKVLKGPKAIGKKYAGTWTDKDTGKTYLDVSQRFVQSALRQATKFGEKTKQLSMYNIGTGEFPPVGDYPGFVTGTNTPEGVVPYAQRLREMGTQGRGYMAQHPTHEWWKQPHMERVYGKARMPQVRGLLAATSTNTQPAPNVTTMSEYVRRAIKGEPMVQPEFRVPQTALSGPRMPKPGARLGLETGKGGRKFNLLAAARGETDPAAYHGPVVQEKVGALSGNRATIVLDRIQTRLSEQPSHGIYAMGKEGQSPEGRNRKLVLDVITKEAKAAGEHPDTFSGNVWAGIREHVSKTGELYGTPLLGTKRGTAGSESKSYDDLFMDRVRAKAKHMGVSLRKMESMLRNGDAELLSRILVPTTAVGAGLLSDRE